MILHYPATGSETAPTELVSVERMILHYPATGSETTPTKLISVGATTGDDLVRSA